MTTRYEQNIKVLFPEPAEKPKPKPKRHGPSFYLAPAPSKPCKAPRLKACKLSECTHLLASDKERMIANAAAQRSAYDGQPLVAPEKPTRNPEKELLEAS